MFFKTNCMIKCLSLESLANVTHQLIGPIHKLRTKWSVVKAAKRPFFTTLHFLYDLQLGLISQSGWPLQTFTALCYEILQHRKTVLKRFSEYQLRCTKFKLVIFIRFSRRPKTNCIIKSRRLDSQNSKICQPLDSYN